jgi:predicted lipoprotein with Yx(FWY)xxD motif
MSRSTVATVALVFAASLGLAACGGGSAGATGTSGSSTQAASAVKDPSTVKIADSSLGKILVDGKGRTLYLFTADGKNMNSMKCDAQCLKLWPPMEGKPKAGAGADAKLINTTDLAGKTQATYAGHPLYYYAPDKAAGDVKGQGIDKVWYVIDAHGKAITKAVPAAKNDSGYGY